MNLALRETAPERETAATCRACGCRDLDLLLPATSVPLYCNVLWSTRAEAVAAARGILELWECRACGHVDNLAFDPGLLDYTPAYDNCLHFSGHFSGYAEALARSLVERLELRGGFVVDIGCGGGDFLALLCRLGDNLGRGYDRSCPREGWPGDGRVTLVPEFFSAAEALPPIDLVCCRQVLEHVDDPQAFLTEIAASPGVTEGTRLFFEVPNGDHSFRRDGVWDMIYEHCSFFVESSLVALFERCGFEVTASYPLFSGQYLGLEARRRASGAAALPVAPEPAALEFRRRHGGLLRDWHERLAAWQAEGTRAVIWGAGSKGVSFLDTLRPEVVVGAVDLNPRKQGRFLPGSGVEVIAPEQLVPLRPDRVILMNPVYRDEVAASLAGLGLAPELVCA